MDLSKFTKLFKIRQEYLQIRFQTRDKEETLEDRVKALETEIIGLVTIIHKLTKEIENQSNEHSQD